MCTYHSYGAVSVKDPKTYILTQSVQLTSKAPCRNVTIENAVWLLGRAGIPYVRLLSTSFLPPSHAHIHVVRTNSIGMQGIRRPPITFPPEVQRTCTCFNVINSDSEKNDCKPTWASMVQTAWHSYTDQCDAWVNCQMTNSMILKWTCNVWHWSHKIFWDMACDARASWTDSHIYVGQQAAIFTVLYGMGI